MNTELLPDELYRRCDPQDIPFDATTDAREAVDVLGQERAVEAARFAIGIRRDGYNVFALGPEGIGKQAILRQFLDREAAAQPAPWDWCYVYNFAEPRRPRALRLASGTATQFRADMLRAIADLRVSMPAAFDNDEYRGGRHKLVHDFEQRQEAAFAALQRTAKGLRVAVIRTDTGVALAPMDGDRVIEPAGFAQLSEQEQSAYKTAMEQVEGELTVLFRQVHDRTHEHLESLSALEREVATAVARRVIDSVRDHYRESPPVLEHLAQVEADVASNAKRFLAKADDEVPEALQRALRGYDDDRERLPRYEVNVMVDHAANHGAPVIFEANPTYSNLIGRIEHVAQLGALVTDFTLLRAGALHRANGGYLLIDAVKLLHQPLAWEALKRALSTHEIRVESVGHTLDLISTVSLEPQPISLDLKVVLFGDREVYYLLATLDPELNELFKVMADFDDSIERGHDSDAAYAKLIAGVVRKEALLPFDRGAVARVIEHAARLASDAQKLSIHLRPITDLLGEADDLARRAGGTLVTAADVQHALDARLRRAGRIGERMLEAIRRNTVLVDTSGAVVGQINALTVVELGSHAFAYPTRITARTRLGGGEVIDIEREVELGGPIHSKGVLILTGLLGARYARHLPLSLLATIVFEQSYGGIEGDSASLAEFCALLSAIADLPIKQSIAVTGSINQRGELQPIGGVNEKIEGFFEVCRERGLTGDQGVLIPRSNVQHLMLSSHLVDAVREHRFHIHAVNDVDQAISILAAREAGVRDGDGHFPEGSVNAIIEHNLSAFADDARNFLHGDERGRPARGGRWTHYARNLSAYRPLIPHAR